MSLIKVNKNENPYDVIGNYIEKHVPVIDDVIAVISINNKIYNELLLVEITTESNFIWQRDWWEGEKSIELVDFFFVSDACKRCDNNDLISRQQAIDALAEDMPQTYTPDGSHPADEGIFMAQEIYADCIQTLKELPTAQPEQKKGKWIDTGGYRAWYAREYKCSKCGDTMLGEANFCPNCGERKEMK